MSTNNSLADRIYQAQCYGSVEPIEYMVPYPNLGTLVEGQNIKLKDQVWLAKEKLTYAGLDQQIRKTVNWLEDLGITNHDRIILHGCPTPAAEIMAFGIWSVGASMVLVGDGDMEGAIRATGPKLIIGKVPETDSAIPAIEINWEKDAFQQFSSATGDRSTPRHKALLTDEALVYWFNRRGIRLSHYNLLVNTSNLLARLDLDKFTSVRVDLPADSTAWAVLQLLLPVYAGIELDPRAGQFIISRPGQWKNPAILINYQRAAESGDGSHRLVICPENTAGLMIDGEPLPLTEIHQAAGADLIIRGHSVMMGYLDEELNDAVFRNDGLKITL